MSDIIRGLLSMAIIPFTWVCYDTILKKKYCSAFEKGVFCGLVFLLQLVALYAVWKIL